MHSNSEHLYGHIPAVMRRCFAAQRAAFAQDRNSGQPRRESLIVETREKAKVLIEHPPVLRARAYVMPLADVNRVTDNNPSHLVTPQERS